MSVREGVRGGFTMELCPNDLSDEGPTLLGGRCQSRYGPPFQQLARIRLSVLFVLFVKIPQIPHFSKTLALLWQIFCVHGIPKSLFL